MDTNVRKQLLIRRILICVFSFILGVVFGCLTGCSEPPSTWPESAEFSQLYTGQDRFSVHKTNIQDGDFSLYVVVDHSNGTEYLMWKGYNKGGICQMMDTDGTASVVMESEK